MDPNYLPVSREGKMARLVEECGEVLQLVGKIGRFGIDNRDPRVPNTLSNRGLLRGELADLQHAISEVLFELDQP